MVNLYSCLRFEEMNQTNDILLTHTHTEMFLILIHIYTVRCVKLKEVSQKQPLKGFGVHIDVVVDLGSPYYHFITAEKCRDSESDWKKEKVMSRESEQL